MNEDEVQKQKYMKIASWGIMVVAVAVLAPVAWMAVSGMMGLAVAGSIGLIGINGAPVLAQKLANAKYRALDAEQVAHIEKVKEDASRNPIETLIDQAMEKRQASDQFRSAISLFKTEVKNFSDQIASFGAQYPEDVARFNTQLDAMKTLLAFREDRYVTLQKELKNFDDAIKRAEAMWKMSQAAQKMNKLAGMELGDPFEKIKADSAINSVMSSMNKAFAEMETALLDNKEVQKATQYNVIENTATAVPALTSTKQKVEA